MTTTAAAALLAFVVGGFIPTLELVTSSYPRTFFLIRRCNSLYMYALMYGLVAATASLLGTTLAISDAIPLQGVKSPFVQALLIGISVKAILHINLFTLTSGKTSTPVGFETFTRFFEGGLLRDLKFFEFEQIATFLASYSTTMGIEDAKKRAKDNVPKTLPDEERQAFLVDVENAASVRTVLELFLRFAGRRTFLYAFTAQPKT